MCCSQTDRAEDKASCFIRPVIQRRGQTDPRSDQDKKKKKILIPILLTLITIAFPTNYSGPSSAPLLCHPSALPLYRPPIGCGCLLISWCVARQTKPPPPSPTKLLCLAMAYPVRGTNYVTGALDGCGCCARTSPFRTQCKVTMCMCSTVASVHWSPRRKLKYFLALF